MALLELLAAMGAGEWVAGAGEGRPIVVASNHHGLVETELLADPLGTQEDTISSAADGKHKVCHGVPGIGILQPLPYFLFAIWYTALVYVWSCIAGASASFNSCSERIMRKNCQLPTVQVSLKKVSQEQTTSAKSQTLVAR